MRFKLANLLTVCLITLAVLSPGLLVLGVVWKYHLQLESTKGLTSEINKLAFNNYTTSQSNTGIIYNLRDATDILLIKHSDNISTQELLRGYIDTLLTYLQDDKFLYLVSWFLVFLSIFISLGFFLYDRYLVYRATILQKQVQMLEKLWQQSIEQ